MQLNLLWVEDRAQTLADAGEVLQEEGWKITNAPTGEDAIALVAKPDAAWHLVILDFQLPLGESETPRLPDELADERVGIEVLRVLRQVHPTLPVIILSGITDYPMFPNLEGEALHLGVSQMLKKPVSLDELLQAVETAIGPE